MDQAGFTDTKIVAKDGDDSICDDLAQDAAYAKAVDIVRARRLITKKNLYTANTELRIRLDCITPLTLATTAPAIRLTSRSGLLRKVPVMTI